MSLSLLLVALTLTQTPDGTGSTSSSPASSADAPAVEAAPVVDAAPVVETAPAVEAAPATEPADTDAPLIEDIAAAAASPDAAPIVTVMMSDRGSGVGDSVVVYRAAGATSWERAPLLGDGQSTSALFIARLPDGLQRSGFQFYVEAKDLAGNTARIGSAEEPILVDKAREATRTRIERQMLAQNAPAPVAIHPGFIMLGYGVGILGAAGSAGYLIDLGISQRRLGEIERELATDDVTADRRTALSRAADGYESAIIYDTAIAAVLGVVGVAGLVTGTGLLIATNLE